MRIAIDISPLQNGHRLRGIGTYARGLLHGLSQLDSGDCYLLYYWRGLPLGLDKDRVPRNSSCIGIPFPRAGRLSALLAQQVLMVPLLARHCWDVYHQLGIVADPSAGGLPWSVFDRCVATFHDVTPLVYEERFLRGRTLRILTYRFMLALTRRAQGVMVDSHATRTDVIRRVGVAPQRVSVAYLAVAPELAAALRAEGAPRVPARVARSYLLTVAGDYPNKDLATLLTAYASIANTPATPDLVIVGPPGPSVAAFRARNLDIAARLHMFQGLTVPQMASLYRGATIVIVPSEYEGFGLPVLEAMTAGAPVISTNAASLPEVAGDAAVLVPPKDPGALADSILTLWSDPRRRQVLVTRGLERARQFSWEATAMATYKAYQRAANRARPTV